MRIAITGASGFVGRAVARTLREAGHEVLALVRTGTGAPGTAHWDPATGALDATALGAVDAVVHLAGENVAGGRWNATRKQRIVGSRGPATMRLCHALASLRKRPHTLIAASATGIYGDRGDELLDEDSSLGSGFLADVARAWEAGTEPARAAGLRVVNLRIGMVLDPSGGALQRMLLPFRLGCGGRLGRGTQWISWITRADLVRVITTALAEPVYRGPTLATAPIAVTNREFTHALGRALHRWTVLPTPAFALRLLFGEMADALLLSSQRTRPTRLLEHGFEFTHPRLDLALSSLLARTDERPAG